MVVWRICSTSRISAMSSLACCTHVEHDSQPDVCKPPRSVSIHLSSVDGHGTDNEAFMPAHTNGPPMESRVRADNRTTARPACAPLRITHPNSLASNAWSRHRSTEPLPKRNRVCTDCMRRIRVPASGREDPSPRFRMRRTDTAARSIRFYSNSRLQARSRLSRSRLHPAASHFTRSGQSHGRSAHRIARKFASRRGPSTVRKLSG
jgi:hypothetical protein